MNLDAVSLGRTGTMVSEIAFGTWRFGRENDRGEIEIGHERAHELLEAYADVEFSDGQFERIAEVAR